MDILAFIQDKKAQAEWLESERLAMAEKDEFFSSWFHREVAGFGIVVSGPRFSMELHLMPDATVTKHLEKYDDVASRFVAIVSEQVEVESVGDFEHVYVQLREHAHLGN